VSNVYKIVSILTLCLAAASFSGCSHARNADTGNWNPKTAAVYLDQREVTWIAWPNAARDHGTFCVSCHTVVPYLLSRPTLRPALGEQGPSDDELKIVENVSKRVRLWNEVGPYYSGGKYDNAKASESRGTEAVLNAVVLASNDARTGKLSEITRSAFNNMWALQLTGGDDRGAWPWLRFGMEPWEASDSQHYGAALAAMAIGIAPEDYRSSPEIQDKLRLLRDYLNSKYAAQSPVNHAVLLWASTKWPGLVDSDRQQAIIREITSAQQSDGGWELSSLAWPGWGVHSLLRKYLRSDWTRQDSQSDGYATGLMTYVLQEAGMSSQNPTVQRGLAWLTRNQNAADGSWPSTSLTKRRMPSSNIGHFMRDAATAYAVLALSENEQRSKNGLVPGNPPHKTSQNSSATKLDLAPGGN
jgi:squalene-hopene/tetraprenyl-beta-curcumene cyclase